MLVQIHLGITLVGVRTALRRLALGADRSIPKIWFCQNCGVVILSAIRKKAFSDCLSSPDTKQSKPTFLGRSEVLLMLERQGVATQYSEYTRCVKHLQFVGLGVVCLWHKCTFLPPWCNRLARRLVKPEAGVRIP